MVRKLKVYKNFDLKKKHQNSIILIGNFDGLHLGHQKLFKLANIYKKKNKLKVGVITFDPIPKMFFNKKIKNYRLSNFNQKVNYLQKFNVDFIISKKFDLKFSQIKYYNFIREILFLKLKSKYIFVSNNFKFGNKRQGNVNLLKQFQNRFGYKVICPKPVFKKKKIISSTLIREYLTKGKLQNANNILNRNWCIEGIVEKGRKLGKKIGFPTCNIDIKNYVIAMPGVYAVRVLVNNEKKYKKGIANLGYRPTFRQKKILLEVNLFNFDKNIYNKKLSVEFLKFIRGEKKFSGIDSLRKQIKKDVLIAKRN